MGKKVLVIRITLNVSKATLELEDSELCLQNSNNKLISTEANNQKKYENRMPTFSDIQSLKKCAFFVSVLKKLLKGKLH